MTHSVSRRAALLGAGAALAAPWALGPTRQTLAQETAMEPFRYCLNTSTIRGQKLGIVAELELAAEVGYSGVEPWIREIEEYTQGGGTLKDLRKRIDDLGLTIESAIGFADWINDDPQKRAEGLEHAKRDMDLLRTLGGRRIAAPPTGGRQQRIDPYEAAVRYRALLELGERMEVTPQLEVWGFSATLSRLGEAVLVAVEAGHRQACLLPDVYHIYKGGSEFHGLKLIHGQAMHVFHVNDYPGEPDRESMNDSHRVFPGDGVAPLGQIFRDLRDVGFRGALSLELFNRDYWQRDAKEVARIGLEKTRQAVEGALEG